MARNNDRKDTIVKMYSIAIIAIAIGLLFILFYFKESKLSQEVFDESSKVDYKVQLKENDYYEKEYLEKDNQYIASLINTVKTNFKYNMNIPEKYDYVYNYKVVAQVLVKNVTNDNTIYRLQEDLLDKKEVNNSGNVKINEVVDIDYPKYNQLISSFKNAYELNNSKATLTVDLFVTVKDFEKSKNVIESKKVATLELPLVENTISISKDTIKDNVNFNISNGGVSIIFLVFGLLILVTGIVYITYIIIYSIKTRTAEMIYEKELKNIKTNYE